MICPRSTTREWPSRDLISGRTISIALVSVHVWWRQRGKKNPKLTLVGDWRLQTCKRPLIRFRNQGAKSGSRVSPERQVQGLNRLKSHSTHLREYPGASAKLAQLKVISALAPLWGLFKEDWKINLSFIPRIKQHSCPPPSKQDTLFTVMRCGLNPPYSSWTR